VTLPGDAFTLLFSESAARAVVAVRPGSEAAFTALLNSHGVPAAILGRTGGVGLDITGTFSVPLPELADVHRATLPALFG
jgi:phosphoribosylformylglycinamidine synthase